MPDQDRIKELGQLGEADFKRLCITARVSSSRPDLDENGWDFFIELPSNRLSHLRRDEQPSAVKLLCQVKATDNLDDLRLSLKVSTLEKLATAALPTFVFILVYEGDDSPARMYLCHIGQDRIAEILTQVRQLEKDGFDDLHRHSMSLRVRSEEEFVDNQKRALLNNIISYTGFDANAYSLKKADMLRTLGYDEGRYRLSLSLAISLPQLVDASLGLSELTIESGVISDVRFDIEMVSTTLTKGVVKIEPSPRGQCQIVASSRRLGWRHSMEADVFLPNIPGLTHTEMKARIVSGLIEAVLAPPSCTLKFDFSAEKLYTLKELSDLARFVCICGQDDARIDFQKDATTFGTVSSVPVPKTALKMSNLDHRLSLLTRFLGHFGYAQPVSLRAQDVTEQEESFRLMGLALSLGTVRTTIESPCGNQKGKIVGIFATPITIKLGTEILNAFCYWRSRVSIRQDRVTFKTLNCDLWDSIQSVTPSNIDRIIKLGVEFEEFTNTRGNGTLMHRAFDESLLRNAVHKAALEVR